MRFFNSRKMRVEENHAHALMIYEPTDFRHFIILLASLYSTKKNKYLSITTHLPFEIQHPSIYPRRKVIGYLLVFFGEMASKLWGVTLHWENCPIFNIGTWDIKYGQTEWHDVPKNISLCLDTGHLIMGSQTIQEARNRLESILLEKGKQIHHLHIHENNLKSDQHLNPKKRGSKRIITDNLLLKLQKGRTYIFEKPS